MDFHIETFPFGMEGLQFPGQWNQIFLAPSLRVPAVKVDSLSPGVHHKIDRASSSEYTSRRYNGFSPSQVIAGLGLVEQGSGRVGCQMGEVEGWSCDSGIIVVVPSLLDKEDAEVGVCSL